MNVFFAFVGILAFCLSTQSFAQPDWEVKIISVKKSSTLKSEPTVGPGGALFQKTELVGKNILKPENGIFLLVTVRVKRLAGKGDFDVSTPVYIIDQEGRKFPRKGNFEEKDGYHIDSLLAGKWYYVDLGYGDYNFYFDVPENLLSPELKISSIGSVKLGNKEEYYGN